MNENNTVLDVQDLKVRFETEDGIVYAVNGLDLKLEKGRAIGLVGETGAGKTTSALALLRLVPDPPGVVECGKMELNGQDVLTMTDKDLEKVRGKDISMIFQDPMTALNPVFTVGDQIAESIFLHEKCTHVEAQKKAVEMLELVGIPGERANEYPHQFSGGMKQRVVIAIALACNPALLIADEPTTALDVTIQAQVLEMMGRLKKELQTSMILITHDLGVVAEACDNVAVMYAGEIVEYGDLKDIYESDKHHPYTVGLFGAIPDLDKDTDRLDPIDGLMPDPANLPKGCNFCPRCPHKRPECETIPPKDIEVTPGHIIRCHLFNKEVE